MTASNRLKFIREYLNLSQQKLADSINQSQATIAGIEKGAQKTFSYSLAEAIYNKYGFSVKWMMSGDGPMIKEKKNTLEQRIAIDDDLYNNINNWGKRLEQIQLENKLNDERMAEILNMSLERFLDICINSPEPKIKELLNIKANFNVTFDWLLVGEGDKQEQKKEENQPVETLGFSPEEIKKIKKMLDKG